MSSIPGYNEPLSPRDPMVKPSDHPSDGFMRWLEQSLYRRLEATPVLTDPVTRVPATNPGAGSNASASGTLGGTQSAGLYQVNAYLETIVVDTGAPECELTLTWTHNGKSFSQTFTPLDGTVITNTQLIVTTIEIDPNTAVGYVLTYTAGTTPGVFRYYAVLGLQLMQPLS